MPTLQADLELQLDAALANLGTLDERFQESAVAFGEALASAIEGATQGTAIEIDTTDALANVEAVTGAAQTAGEAVVEAGAQGTGALSEVGSAALAAGADLAQAGQEGTQALDDITSSGGGAAEAISSVGSESRSTSEEVGGLEGASAGLAGSLALAKGEGRGAAEAVGELGVISGGTAGAILGGAAALGEFFFSGVKAESAANRLEHAFGAEADAIKRIDIGGLTGNLDQLAQKVGTTGAQLDNGLAKLGEFGRVAGFTKDQTANFTQEVTALALRSVALNPALGSVDEVITRIQRGLATGGRFAQQFYLNLSKPDIIEHATQLFGVHADQLTQTQKAYAGADLAVHGLGDTLGKDFTAGADTADNKLKALKATLENAFEKASTGALVDSLISLLNAMLPVATTAISILAPAMKAVSIALAAVGPALPAIVAGFAAFQIATLASAAVRGLGISVGLLPGELASAAEVDAFFIAGLQATAESSVLAAAGIETMGAAAATTTPEVVALDGAMDANPIGVFAAVIGVALGALGLFGGGAKEAATDLTKLGNETDVTYTKLAQFIAALQHSQAPDWLKDHIVQNSLKDFRDLADQNVGAAQRLGQAYVDAGVITEAQFNKAIEHGIKLQTDAAAAAAQNATATGQLTAAQQDALFTSAAVSEQAKNQDTINKSAVTTSIALAAAKGVDTAATRDQATAYAEASAAASNYKTSLDVLNSGTLSVLAAQQSAAASLQSLVKDYKSGQDALNLNTEAGNKNISMLVQATQGAETYAASLVQADGNNIRANASLQTFTGGLVDFLVKSGAGAPAIVELVKNLGLVGTVTAETAAKVPGLAELLATQLPAAATAATGALAGIPPAAQAALDSTLASFNTTLPAIRAAVADQMAAGAASFDEAIHRLPPAAQDALAAASAATGLGMDVIAGASATGGTTAADKFGSSYKEGTVTGADAAAAAGAAAIAAEKQVVSVSDDWGRRAGRAFGQGMIDGINAKVSGVYAAGQDLARAAKSGADNAGSPTEHLFWDSGALWASTIASALRRGEREVVEEATSIARAAAGAHGGGGFFGGGRFGPFVPHAPQQVVAPISSPAETQTTTANFVISVPITVHSSDPQSGEDVGDAAARRFVTTAQPALAAFLGGRR